MPTALARTQVTHTPMIQHALDVARQEWPDDADRDGRLLARLLTKAAEDLEAAQEERREVRRARLLAAAGRFTGTYPSGYLEEIREGWPE